MAKEQGDDGRIGAKTSDASTWIDATRSGRALPCRLHAAHIVANSQWPLRGARRWIEIMACQWRSKVNISRGLQSLAIIYDDVRHKVQLDDDEGAITS